MAAPHIPIGTSRTFGKGQQQIILSVTHGSRDRRMPPGEQDHVLRMNRGRVSLELLFFMVDVLAQAQEREFSPNRPRAKGRYMGHEMLLAAIRQAAEQGHEAAWETVKEQCANSKWSKRKA